MSGAMGDRTDWTDEQCLQFAAVAFRHAPKNLPTGVTLEDIRLAAKVVLGNDSPESGVSWAEEHMALHWIDRYAAGIDEEPQMDRILSCVQVTPEPPGEVVVTRDEDGEIVMVSRQDDEGRILKVIATTTHAGGKARALLTEQGRLLFEPRGSDFYVGTTDGRMGGLVYSDDDAFWPRVLLHAARMHTAKATAAAGVLDWVRNKRTLLSARMSAGVFHAQEALDMTMLSRLEHFLTQQPAAVDESFRRDAERYRWLRLNAREAWEAATLLDVVEAGGHRLDARIDEDMANEADQQHGGES